MPDTKDVSLDELMFVAIEKAKEEYNGHLTGTINLTPKDGKPEKWVFICSRLYMEDNSPTSTEGDKPCPCTARNL